MTSSDRMRLLGDIEQALLDARRLADADYDRARGIDSVREAKVMIGVVNRALAAVRNLQSDPVVERLVPSARLDAEEASGCSCHIVAPCGYCTSQTGISAD